MSDGIFQRMNSAMLRSSIPGPIFSLVGTVLSCDGETLVIQACDKGQVPFIIDATFNVPALVSFFYTSSICLGFFLLGYF